MADEPASAGASTGLSPAGNGVPPPVHHGSRLLYLIVLAGVAFGLYLTWQGSQDAARGTGLVGCSLLGAALVRLVLPPRYAGPLSSRKKTSDVLAFTALGAGVLGVALMLP
jgi:hypothetical protein